MFIRRDLRCPMSRSGYNHYLKYPRCHRTSCSFHGPRMEIHSHSHWDHQKVQLPLQNSGKMNLMWSHIDHLADMRSSLRTHANSFQIYFFLEDIPVSSHQKRTMKFYKRTEWKHESMQRKRNNINTFEGSRIIFWDIQMFAALVRIAES